MSIASPPRLGKGLRSDKRNGPLTRKASTGALFVLPTALVVLVFFLVPLGLLVWMSLSDWPLLGDPRFIGAENYIALTQNEQFTRAAVFTLAYTFITTLVLAIMTFVLVALSHEERKGAKFYRTAYFLPYVVGLASASLMWLVDLNDAVGVFPDILRRFGLIEGSAGFLTTPTLATASVVAMVTWKFVGFQVVILIAGLQSIPEDSIEAARCDGANALQRLRFIVLPFLRPTIALLLILSITGSLLAFDQFMVMTQGGPDNSTITLVLSIYNTAFNSYDVGKAAAMAIVLLAALVVLNGLQLRLLKGKD